MRRHRLPVRTWALPIVGIALVGGLVAAPAAAGAAVPPSRFSYTGNAYGTTVSVGTTVSSGPTALVTLGCGVDAGIHKSNTTASVDLNPLGTTGTVTTTADTSSGPTQSQTTAETQQVVLLGGLISADALRAVSTTTHDSSGFSVSGNGSTMANLVINGIAITAVPSPNTRLDLGGLGYVVLNEQNSKVTNRKAALTVNMIHLFITLDNVDNIPVGTEIIVSHAKSDLEGSISGFLDGRAYGTSARVDDLVRSGPTALVIMPCLGTFGNVRTNSTADGNFPNILTSATVTSTAQGTVTATSDIGETTSKVEGLNLLGGLVTADAVKADAHASSDGTTPAFSDDGSTLLNISVSGHPEITADAAPNTKIDVAGLGTLYIHRVIHHADSIEVRMIELVIRQAPNPFGLAVGTDVRIAVAEASVH